jgi:hypothetical protein
MRCKGTRVPRKQHWSQNVEPSRDAVLQAIQSNSQNVVYLNPESEHPLIDMEQGVPASWLEQEAEADEFDSCPWLSDLLLCTDQHYNDAVAPSDDAPLF